MFNFAVGATSLGPSLIRGFLIIDKGRQRDILVYMGR